VAINDTSGVAGLIQPRAHVDVLFTRPGSMAEAVTTTILEMWSCWRSAATRKGPTRPNRRRSRTGSGSSSSQSATLLVTPAQARKLELAKNQGKISLALRNPLDRTAASDSSATTGHELYAGLPQAKPPVPRSQPKTRCTESRGKKRAAAQTRESNRRLPRRQARSGKFLMRNPIPLLLALSAFGSARALWLRSPL